MAEPGQKRKKRKKWKSLSRSMQRLVLFVSLVILIVASWLNFTIARAELSTMFNLNSAQVVNSMKVIIEVIGGVEEYATEVIAVWEAIPDDLLLSQESEQYRACFHTFETSAYHGVLSEALEKLKKDLTLGDMYLCAINTETGRLVYLLDLDTAVDSNGRPVGSWRDLTPEQTRRIIPSEATGIGDHVIEAEDLGRILVFSTRIAPDRAPYVLLAVYEYPVVISGITATVYAVIYVIVLTLVIIVIVLITRRRIRKRLVKPINSITSAAEQYVEKKKQGSSAFKSFGQLNIHTGDELEELGEVMAQMEEDIGVYEKDLAEAAAMQEHIQTELSVATGIQTHMLPDAKKTFPHREEFAIYASMDPAREVGGDFYDFFLIDEDHLGIVIADVSGKGIPAALFMMSSMIVINNLATLGFSPKEVLEKANDKICSSNALNMFVTVWFGILDLTTGEVTAANAGHEYPAICTKKNGFSLLHNRHGMVIGGMEGIRYREHSFTLEKEGVLYLYTDGVPEATDAEDQMYGTDRLTEILNAHTSDSPEEICAAVKADIDAFVKDAPQFDDITMLCIRYYGRR